MPRPPEVERAGSRLANVLRATSTRLRVRQILASGGLGVVRRRPTAAAAARELELRNPRFHNLIVTAEELLRDPDRIPGYMRARVLSDADRAVASLDLTNVVPLRRAVAGNLVALAALVSGIVIWTRVPGADLLFRPVGPAATALAPGEVVIDIASPEYARRPAVRLRSPASIDALAGSRATIRVGGDTAPRIRLNGAPLSADATGGVTAVLDRSGYVAVDSGSQQRLLPLTVTPDLAPDVRIVAPGRDLRVPNARSGIPVRATAADDLGLRSLELRYTIVSGGGEQFTFTEGTVPVTLNRESDRSWRVDGIIPLPSLKLEPGDALIYRAVAADARPGQAGQASSDTYFVEVAGPGDVALEGVDMPPDRERYALSEAMIVLKIQRLLAAQSTMARPAVVETAANIAAEQRAVRTNFVFLLGGEVEDEVVEAEESHEIQEGRLANQARREIVAATVRMTHVERALAAVSPAAALPQAQEAVRLLQRAFGRSRYLLRALPSRIRIDPARRLSGDLTSAADWTRVLAPVPEDPQTAAAREALVVLVAVARDPSAPDVSARLTSLAEQVLAIGADARLASQSILAARLYLAAGQSDRAKSALQAAAVPLVVMSQRGRVDGTAASREAARIAGAAGR